MCKLNKSLYGFKQAGCQWPKELSNSLTKYGFHRFVHDNCLFLKREIEDINFLVVIIYVDAILICVVDNNTIQQVKDYLHDMYTIKDLGFAKFFLGVEITQNKAGITLS